MLSFDSFKEFIYKDFNKNISLKKNNKYFEINIKSNDIYSLINYLKENSKFKFEQLIDITAIDYPAREIRFNIVYILLSLSINQRIVVQAQLNEGESIESITSIYNTANWYERECYDLFGIKFLNHPDLRRIMTDYNFEGHPLRKDFPLTGHSEVRYDDLENKVVYEPVKLTQEYRNFDYSSPWEGLPNELKGDEKIDKNNIK